jgi:hypothetical protein
MIGYASRHIKPVFLDNIISPCSPYRAVLVVSHSVTRSEDSTTPSIATNAIVKVLSTFGWAYPAGPKRREDPDASSVIDQDMEVDGRRLNNAHRLAVPVVDAHEAMANTASPPGQPAIDMESPVPPARYRLTSLSMGPSRELANRCANIISRWATLPLGIFTGRLIVNHFLANSGRSSTGSPYGILDPLTELHKGNFATISVLVSRVLLCEAIRIAILLGLSGCRLAVTRYIGAGFCGWGTL